MSATRRIVRSIWETLWVLRDQVTFKADCDRGSLTLVVSTIPPGGGPPPHVHHQQEEAHYMLEGSIRGCWPLCTRHLANIMVYDDMRDVGAHLSVEWTDGGPVRRLQMNSMCMFMHLPRNACSPPESTDG